MTRIDSLQQENETLRDRLSKLSEASLRINESLDFKTVFQEVLDSACSLTGARYRVITLLDGSNEVQNHLAPRHARRESAKAMGHLETSAARTPKLAHRPQAEDSPIPYPL